MAQKPHTKISKSIWHERRLKKFPDTIKKRNFLKKISDFRFPTFFSFSQLSKSHQRWVWFWWLPPSFLPSCRDSDFFLQSNSSLFYGKAKKKSAAVQWSPTKKGGEIALKWILQTIFCVSLSFLTNLSSGGLDSTTGGGVSSFFSPQNNWVNRKNPSPPTTVCFPHSTPERREARIVISHRRKDKTSIDRQKDFFSFRFPDLFRSIQYGGWGCVCTPLRTHPFFCHNTSSSFPFFSFPDGWLVCQKDGGRKNICRRRRFYRWQETIAHSRSTNQGFPAKD